MSRNLLTFRGFTWRALVGAGAAAVALATTLMTAPPALAGEADDLQVMIDRARKGADDLDALDNQKAARDEVTVMRVWLDEAWRLRSEQKYDDVRLVLDRCDAQAVMVREKITAAKLSSQAAEKEKAVQRVRKNIDNTRKAIEQALLQKAALEAKGK